MKKFFTFLMLSAAFKISAQITITAANMPSINDTIRYTNAPIGNFDFKLTGANYSWNYTTLGITDQTVAKFQSLAGTPYATLAFSGMPFGSIGVKQADSVGSGQAAIKNVYNFYSKNSTGWNAVGTGFTLSALPIPAGGVYSDKDEIFTFPLKYNDQDSTTFFVKTPLGNQFISLGYYKQSGNRVNKVEGWGIISTPYGNSIPCLKIKSRVNEIDSLNISSLSLSVGFPNNRVEYKWLSTSEKIPVLEVSGTEIAGVFVPTAIKYRDNYRAAEPSPFLPNVRFSANKTSGVQVFDTFKLINNSTPPFVNTYQWTIIPSTGVRFVKATTANSANPSLVFDSTGTYTVKLSATNFSGSADSTALNMITIGKKAGLKGLHVNSLSLYPNPVKNEFHFSNAGFENKVCRVFDITGKLVSEQLITGNLTIDCTALSIGIYTVVVIDNETFYYDQIVKE